MTEVTILQPFNCATCGGSFYYRHYCPAMPWAPTFTITTYPEPPRNSGEADAVHGPTALGTHHDNTLEGKHTGPGARP